MAPLDHNFCSGCLNAGRRMVLIDEFRKRCFFQIINEIPMCKTEVPSLWLCWECAALVRRFTHFKEQVKHSYKTLLEAGEQNLNLESCPTPKLTIQELYNLDATDTDHSHIDTAVLETQDNSQPAAPNSGIKHEIKIENQFKSELDSPSDNDGEFLIEYVSQKKKTKKGKAKNKKKKEVQVYKEVELTDKELEEERREMETREEYVNAMFRCENCLVSFPNADDLKDHIAMKHELNAAHHRCPVCKCSFVSEISFNYHTNKHRQRYQCNVCSVRVKSKRAAEKHHDSAHGVAPSFESVPTLDNDVPEDATEAVTNGVKPEATFPCGQCAKTFRWKTSLRKHLETHRIESGQKRRPFCEPCKLSFTTTSNLQKHVKTSSKHQIQLKLRKLNESLPAEAISPEKRQAHVEQIKCAVNSARQQYPCAHCGKRFQWRGNLLRHLHSHAAKASGSLRCAPCGRAFSSPATLAQHLRASRSHVPEHQLRHRCADCPRRFASKTRLRDHVDWDHRQLFRHTCDHCQKVFKSHTSLYLHKQVVHKKDSAEHLCDHCGKPFPNHAKLRCHIIALHTSESPYKCGSCAARFSWHSCLSRHVRRVHK